jgi:serine/threonine protein kinase
MPLAAGTRLGPYEVLGLIGAGGMGEVYKARDTRLDRTVAMKGPPADLSSDRDRRSRHHRSGSCRYAGSGGSAQKCRDFRTSTR